MRIRRRSLRKGLIVTGCVFGAPGFPLALFGGGLMAMGCALHFWSKGCLEQNRRLITAGPYRFTRNPFYLANAVIDAGLCLVIGVGWITAIYAICWGIAYRDTIVSEEAKLRGLFPEEFERYAARVPRLLPNGRSWPAESVTGRFSLDNDGLARGREYARLLGIAIGPAVILAAALLRRHELGIFLPENATLLAFVVAVPSAWVVKIALAELLRRPQTALLPWLDSQRGRLVLALVLGGLAVGCAVVLPWLAVVAALWSLLVLLDSLGAGRAAALGANARTGWSYLPAIVTGTVAATACVAALTR